MNTETERYNHDKIQAEIAKLIAETIKMGKENAKITAETAKLHRERWWYALVPMTAAMAAGAGLLGGGLALAKFLQ